MSRPVKALQALSLRDSLAKTVRLLTRQGIEVQFRGHQPFVKSRGNKATVLVLPELNDNASPDLIEAIQGYLDHEVGHIFYTPFARAAKGAAKSRIKAQLLNIVEDIRLEKLLPRDLPGTKENLERMYEKFIPTMCDKPVKEAIATGNPSTAFCGTIVVAMRALSGQKAFQTYMDDNKLWPHFMPLLQKMPNLSRRLREMETFDDVESLVDDVIEAMTPPPPPPPPLAPEPEEEEQKAPPQQSQPQLPDDEEDESEPDQGDDGDRDDDADPQDGDEGDDGEESDESGGEGHGDGEGTDDGEEGEEPGKCKGDKGQDEGEPDGPGGSDIEGDDDTPPPPADQGDDEGDEDGNSDADSDTEEDGEPGGRRKGASSITDALKQLDPTSRKALYLYKQRHQTLDQIAAELSVTEDEVADLLREARRKLVDIMKGA